MEQRRLGRTGHLSSVVTFGTAGIGRVDQDEADRAVQTVLDHGVNHFDVAPSYGEAEVRLNPWMSCMPEKGIFLGCKTKQRTRTRPRRSCTDRSSGSGRIGSTSTSSTRWASSHELDECTAKGGALEALVEARASGIVRWLGITGHTHDAPRTHLEALRRFDFDTVMFPLNFVLWAIPEYRRDAEALLDECRQKDVGVHIIKTRRQGPVGRPSQDAHHLVRALHGSGDHRPGGGLRPVPAGHDAQQRRRRDGAAEGAVRGRAVPAAGRGGAGGAAGDGDRYHSPFVGTWA